MTAASRVIHLRTFLFPVEGEVDIVLLPYSLTVL